MGRYKVEVEFDDRTAVQEQRQRYFGALDSYSALGIGHSKTRTSTILFSSPKKEDLAALVDALRDIKVLSVSLR